MAVAGTVTHVNANEFSEAIKGETLVVVDFYATWCGPCKSLAPTLETMAKENTNVLFIKVDVDEFEELAMAHKVHAMPTLIAFKKGAEVGRVIGASENEIKKMVNTNV